MSDVLARNVPKLERLARNYGLDFYPVDFELTPASFMLEISVYGLPVRMPHWSFGVRYIHQLVRQSMGNSRIFEVMFPGDPCHAYLQETNTDSENTLVIAHVLGHADFSKNNHLFERYHKMSGGNIVEMAASHAHQIENAMREHGVEKVEPVLDAALALESHVDIGQELHRGRYVRPACQAACCAPRGGSDMGGFQKRYENLPGQVAREHTPHATRAPVPPHPEQDLLWFISQYGEELEDWERDIFLAVRAESFYFYPVFSCQIMNEGWASYWHARLLREADFLPQDQYLSAIKCHSDVVSPYASGEQTSLQINPYHLGFSMWEHIVETQGLEAARRILREEDDFSFIRNHLDRDMADKLGLFVWEAKRDGEIKVINRDINLLRENILAPRFNYGAPRIAVSEMRPDGTLILTHDHKTDGRGLDVQRAEQVLQYVHRLWRRPVRMVTADRDGRDEIVSVGN